MSRFALCGTRALCLGLLIASAASCDVYDARLSSAARNPMLLDASMLAPILDPSARGTATGVARAAAAPGEPETESDDDAGVPARSPDEPADPCGNGSLDPGENCDVAIARGNPGACPEGCSGRNGCAQQVPVGRGCALHCEEQAISEAVPDDGCCPPLANAANDSDCSAVCGDGVREGGESCDPPETCVSASACASPDTCHSAYYTGSPERCDARCELRDVEACVAGDGCCPLGCTFERDGDCERPGEEPACDETCPDAAGLSDCQRAHGTDACAACDCERCVAAARACLDSGAACEAVARCAAEHACFGLDCLCGRYGLDICQRAPSGPCVRELFAAAGFGGALIPQLTAQTWIDGPIGRALQLLGCRSQQCALECGRFAAD